RRPAPQPFPPPSTSLTVNLPHRQPPSPSTSLTIDIDPRPSPDISPFMPLADSFSLGTRGRSEPSGRLGAGFRYLSFRKVLFFRGATRSAAPFLPEDAFFSIQAHRKLGAAPGLRHLYA